MSVTIRNYPRKPLSDKERTIRETLDRLGNEAHPPYIFVSVADASLLQGVLNSFTNGGTVWLEDGTYSGNLTISNSYTTLIGNGWGTVLTGSVLLAAGSCQIENLSIRATNQAYGLKLFRSGGDVPRTRISHVWVGASADGAGDGPTIGMWLDGAIVTRVENCTIAFNDEDGLYINTTNSGSASSPFYTTNVNTFQDCTFNGNGQGGSTGWGVKMEGGTAGVGGEPTPAIAGMMLNVFRGGNMEDNYSGEFYCDNATFTVLDGIDFERSIAHAIDNSVFISSTQPVLVQNCNFVVDPSPHGASVTRMILLSGVAGGRVLCNRESGGYGTGAVIVFDENCVGCEAHDNLLWNSGYGRVINNRGSMYGPAQVV